MRSGAAYARRLRRHCPPPCSCAGRPIMVRCAMRCASSCARRRGAWSSSRSSAASIRRAYTSPSRGFCRRTIFTGRCSRSATTARRLPQRRRRSRCARRSPTRLRPSSRRSMTRWHTRRSTLSTRGSRSAGRPITRSRSTAARPTGAMSFCIPCRRASRMSTTMRRSPCRDTTSTACAA